MTQKEFDAQMGQLYYEQEKALQPLRMQVDEFNAQNAELLQLAPEKPDVPKRCPLNEGYIQNFSSL